MAESNHFLSGKKIIVSGAGISGLTFVIALRKTWNSDLPFPDIHVYDANPQKQTDAQDGYSLSFNGLDKDGGMVALRDIGVLDRVMDKALVGMEASPGFQIWDNNWYPIASILKAPLFEDLPSIMVRIKKRELRNILIEQAEAASTLHWSSEIASAKRLDGGRIQVQLSAAGDDGTSTSTAEECDLLIAADGTHSKLRESFRPDDVLTYAGAVQFGGVSSFEEGKIPAPVDRFWGMTITGQGAGCFFTPIDKSRVLWAISRWERDAPRDGYKPDDSAAFEVMKQDALDLGKSMVEPFPTLVEHTVQEQSFIWPARDKQPFGHDASLEGVVFIGDANHHLSSFGGNGGNLALKDGWDLAQQLSTGTSLDSAVAAYDKIALPRAQKSLKESHDRMNQSHYTGMKFTFLKGALKAGAAFMNFAGRG